MKGVKGSRDRGSGEGWVDFLVYTFICDEDDGAGFLESETKGKNGLEIYER